MKFRNPANGYVETSTAPGFFALLFGPLYFGSKGAWGHAVFEDALAQHDLAMKYSVRLSGHFNAGQTLVFAYSVHES